MLSTPFFSPQEDGSLDFFIMPSFIKKLNNEVKNPILGSKKLSIFLDDLIESGEENTFLQFKLIVFSGASLEKAKNHEGAVFFTFPYKFQDVFLKEMMEEMEERDSKNKSFFYDEKEEKSILFVGILQD